MASTARSTDKIHPKSAFRVGFVYSAPHHAQAGRGTDTMSRNYSESAFGGVHSKERKFVIVAKYYDHVLALPIYTHEGDGLLRKSNRQEFVSIRDEDSEYEAPAETENGILYHVRMEDHRNGGEYNYFMMTDQTAVHLTAPAIHNFKQKCTISGKLLPESVTKLVSLFTTQLMKGVPKMETPDNDAPKTPRALAPISGNAAPLALRTNTPDTTTTPKAPQELEEGEWTEVASKSTRSTRSIISRASPYPPRGGGIDSYRPSRDSYRSSTTDSYRSRAPYTLSQMSRH